MDEITEEGIRYFMNGYQNDLELLVNNAIVTVEDWIDERGISPCSTFIFDIDDTLLSTTYHKLGWMEGELLPPLEPIVDFYHFVQKLGFKTVLLTGRGEIARNWTINNLNQEGIVGYERLILRSPTELLMSPDRYKSQRRRQLVERDGLCIIGNIGDQITDLIGEYAGKVKIKVPHPADMN